MARTANEAGGETLALAKRAWRCGRRTSASLPGRRTTLAGPAVDHPGGDGGRRPWLGRRTLDGSVALAKRAWQRPRQGPRTTLTGTADDPGGRRTAEFRELAGEDGSGRCSCDLVASPNIATSVCASAARCVGEAERKTPSSPASGGCGWVSRYEDGATHDHSMGGARRGTVLNPKPLKPKPFCHSRPTRPVPQESHLDVLHDDLRVKEPLSSLFLARQGP